MQSLELLKKELVTQKKLLNERGYDVATKNANPSPSEITEAIKAVSFGGPSGIDFSKVTADDSDVAVGKMYYNKDAELVMGTLVKPSGNITIERNDTYDVTLYETAVVDVQPKLMVKVVSENNTYNASDDGVDGYSSVVVDVPDIDLSQTTATEDDVRVGKEFYNASGAKVTGTYVDMLQQYIYDRQSCSWLFGKNAKLANFDFVEKLDFSGITDASYMFAYCPKLAKFPNIDTSQFKKMENFLYCESTANGQQNLSLTELSLNIENATSLNLFASSNKALKTISLTGGTKCTTYSSAFSNCIALETVGVIDARSVTGTSNLSSIFNGCTNLTNLTIKNVSVNLTIGSGTTYGHLLTLDSLLNTIQELWIRTGTQARTLTMGTANTAKLENIYVKLIDITEEMRAEDEYIDKKAPFVVCESTDEGAMLITEYVTTIKKWKLA